MNASIGVWLLKAVSCHDLISEMCCGLLLIPVYSVNVLCQRTKYWWITSSERRPSHPPICILVSVLFYNVGWIWITLFPPPPPKKKKVVASCPRKTKGIPWDSLWEQCILEALVLSPWKKLWRQTPVWLIGSCMSSIQLISYSQYALSVLSSELSWDFVHPKITQEGHCPQELTDN